jgi:hypothetical protein
MLVPAGAGVTARAQPADGGIAAWLDGLDPATRDALARAHAARAAELGAVVHQSDGRVVPIPPLLTPEPWSGADQRAIEADAHALLSSLAAATRWLMAGAGQHLAARLFAAFGPLESAALSTGWARAERLATARVDFLIDRAGRPRALEVNATIPAMQGYSDAVAASFLETVGRARGADARRIDQSIADNGRNSDDLHAALKDHYARAGGHARDPSIAIVARAGDAQLGELQHYVRRFAELGSECALFTPADARREPDGALALGGRRWDLIYRHVFARRLDPAGDFARACLEPERHQLWNPIASHLEAKGMLALLSAAAADGALGRELGLAEAELAAIDRALPWTRLLAAGATRGPSGEPLADLPAEVAANGARFVLKRSWDYGGRSVFLGDGHDDRAAARAGELLGAARPLAWPELVAAAATDPRDAWVVQELVAFAPSRRWLAGPDGARAIDLFLDRSAFTNLGTAVRPRGGAARAAPGKIVNILGGGGLAPLIRDDVLAAL